MFTTYMLETSPDKYTEFRKLDLPFPSNRSRDSCILFDKIIDRLSEVIDSSPILVL